MKRNCGYRFPEEVVKFPVSHRIVGRLVLSGGL